ncbi:complex I intermediate-associated protein [Hypoxylon rubiginosum]|uniref:Complex I intermediate-associated protein n=1 Tax=Hypoxylon rubiginosum TaxID=110542 RepID=A0ACB9YPZ4_9PEZI|nr:complex I intermediate-associated protein [Hypoxylon rubiginosum]
MRSQLARNVLRRLLASELPATLPPSFALSRPSLRVYPVRSRVARTPQRRSFMKLFQKAPRALKEIDAEPGYETLLQYRAAENDSVRPPLRAELVKAWREFFAYKTRYGRTVNSTQAMCAYRVLLHLSAQTTNARDTELSDDDLRTARECLSKPPRDDFTNHLELSRTIYAELERRGAHQAKDFYALLAALSQYGKALEARDLVLDYYYGMRGQEPDAVRLRHFIPVIRGLAKEGHELELLDLVSQARKAGVEYDPALHGIMTTYFAQKDNTGETKHWFNKPISRNLPPAPTTYYEILRFALRNDQQEWAMGVYQNLIAGLESGPWGSHKPSWDTSLQWAIMLLGKGVDHIEHMMNVAYEHTKDKPSAQPNIGTINCLVKIATEKNDPYLAERFLALSKKMGFNPNYKTYMLQLEYRIRANDLDGAFAAYQSLQDLEETTKDRELSVLNSFIRALCAVPNPNHERVLDVTSYLEQRRVTLEPETVVSICMAFLKNDETFEVIDTLSLHTVHYSVAERHMVRTAFVEYCLDKKNSTARVWDAYALLRQFFPEVAVEARVRIMDAFFDRRRADMAAHVFGHMRSHGNLTFRPVLETYVRFLEGIGRCPDDESLKTVHNMLKMDTTIQPNTMLYNALMIGYVACDQPYRALDFWKEITMSPEGPSYATLEIVFRTYEITSDGDGLANELWEKIKRMEIEVPENIYVAYVVTTAAHGHLADAKTLLENMDNVVGKGPDLHNLGIVFNALPSQETKDEFESWAKGEYPRVWNALKEKHGRRRNDQGLAVFKLRRPCKA